MVGYLKNRNIKQIEHNLTKNVLIKEITIYNFVLFCFLRMQWSSTGEFNFIAILCLLDSNLCPWDGVASVVSLCCLKWHSRLKWIRSDSRDKRFWLCLANKRSISYKQTKTKKSDLKWWHLKYFDFTDYALLLKKTIQRMVGFPDYDSSCILKSLVKIIGILWQG